MDHSASYSTHASHHTRQHLFPQLPPPSQLHLPVPSFNRSNTLPPISNMPQDSRYPPASYHPSLSPGSGPISPSTNHASWTTHRTSSSREEIHPLRRKESKSKIIDRELSHERIAPVHVSQDHLREPDDSMPAASDFVKKLYKMLEDSTFSHVVSWNQSGDAFVVKDMNEFTKSILPRMFKHSNFASFVRQLNKYDFHKVKNSDDQQFGEHSWTFRHPDFQADRRDALENIKRKVPAQRKQPPPPPVRTNNQGSPAPSPSDSTDSNVIQSMQAQIDRLTQSNEEITVRFEQLEEKYRGVVNDMVGFQRNFQQQDGLMQNLIQYMLALDNSKSKVKEEPRADTFTPDGNAYNAVAEIQGVGTSYRDDDVAHTSLSQMNEISRRVNAASMPFSNVNGSISPVSGPSNSRIITANGISQTSGQNGALNSPPLNREEAIQRVQELSRARAEQQLPPAVLSEMQMQQNQIASPTSSHHSSSSRHSNDLSGIQTPYTNGTEPLYMSDGGGMNIYSQAGMLEHMENADNAGLQIFTVGHLIPKQMSSDDNAMWNLDPSNMGNMDMFTNNNGIIDDFTSTQEQSSSDSSIYGISDMSSSLMPANGHVSVSDATEAGSIMVRTGTPQKLRVRRSTFVPTWAVPPRVLLVDDDAVSRRLSSKFLQVFGCTIDIAVDGDIAVSKMNFESYDLVLMDIVMPKMNGIDATLFIRKFNQMTPIISMTSNSGPKEVEHYKRNGMNDILPKPFTKQGLLTILEKYLNHLTFTHEMARVPRSVGIPPLSDSSFDQALMITAANPPQEDDEEGKNNPFAGMGVSDDDYNVIMNQFVQHSGQSFSGLQGALGQNDKRMLDDSSDGRENKRGRFELLE